jgi:hypothetical protein
MRARINAVLIAGEAVVGEADITYAELAKRLRKHGLK